MFKRILAALLCSVITASVCCSCGAQKSVSTTSDSTQKTTGVQITTAEEPIEPSKENVDPAKAEIANYTAPQKGDKIVTINIKDYGAVKIRLFPEYASKGVENFIGLAEQDYYNGVIFHRIISNFMIQGGDPQGTGMGGQSIWGEKFDGGTDPHLIHCPGALAYANSGSTATNGSQFYIVTGEAVTESYLGQIEAAYGKTFSPSAKEIYLKQGGTPHLDGGYTVFGQVFDGLDIVFKIQNVPTGSQDRPVTPVVIESVEVSEYNGEELKWYISDYN